MITPAIRGAVSAAKWLGRSKAAKGTAKAVGVGGGLMAGEHYLSESMAGAEEAPAEGEEAPQAAPAPPKKLSISKLPGGSVRISYHTSDARSEKLDAILSAYGAYTVSKVKGQEMKSYTLTAREYERLSKEGALGG
jgi:hypothetical protein